MLLEEREFIGANIKQFHAN